MDAVKNLFLLMLALLASALVLYADKHMFCGNLIRQFASREYYNVAGVVSYSQVKQITMRGKGGGSKVGDIVDIGYHYKVNGQTYEGNRFRYNNELITGHIAGTLSADSIWARNIVEHYTVGSIIQVFYDPINPAESLLSPGINGNDFLTIFSPILPFNLGFPIWFHAHERRGWFS